MEYILTNRPLILVVPLDYLIKYYNAFPDVWFIDNVKFYIVVEVYDIPLYLLPNVSLEKYNSTFLNVETYYAIVYVLLSNKLSK